MTDSPSHKAPGPLARFGHAAWRWLWYAVAFVLIATAVTLTLARLLLPFAGEYRAELEARVESYLGHEVSIGELDIEWQGLGPRVQMSRFEVHGIGGGDSIVFDHAYIRLRPVWSEGAPSLRLDDFSLIGFTLRARMDEAGRIRAFGETLDPAALGGLAPGPAADDPAAGDPAADGAGAASPASAEATGVPAALEQIFSIRRLQVRDAVLEIARPDAPPTRWTDIGLTLVNSGEDHSLSVRVNPPEGVGTRLAGRLSFSGRPADYREWRASLYLEARQLSLSALAGLLPEAAAVRPAGGQVDASLWSQWNGGRLLEARVEAGADALALVAGDERVRFEQLGGRLRLWQPTPAQWQIDVGDLQVRRDGRDWSGERLSYALEDDGDWRLAADFLRTEDAAAIAGILPLDAELRERLRTHAPRGDLHGVNLAVASGGDFQLRADFRDLGWSPHGDVPGITGLDGRAWLRADGGRVALESSGVDFEAPGLFREPLRMQELSATIGLRPVAGGFDLHAPRVHLRNKDLRGRGRARVELRDGESPRLDLQFEYRDGVATAVPRYLPAGIMPEPVVEWLDAAFRAGRVPQGSFVLRGTADDFPYRAHNGIFDVRFEVVDTALHYGDGWPAVRGLGGRVRFTGPSLTITADAGRTRDLQLRRGRARFDDLRTGLLEIDLDADGPLDDMLRVVDGSPIGPRFAAVLDGTRGRGDAALSLALAVPVERVEDTRVDGSVRLDGAGLTQSRHGLDFDRIEGEVAFTGDSVTIEGLQARLRARPIQVHAATRDGVARVRVEGRFAPAELVPALAQGALSGASGRSAWRVDVDVPLAADGDARLAATSALEDTRIDLPPPLGKPAGEARRVRVDMTLGADTVYARYGPDTRLVLALAADDGLAVRRAGLAFSGRPALPGRDGLRVSGTLDRLPLAPWAARFAGGGSRAAEAGLPLVELDLRIGRVDFHGYRLSEAALAGGLERGAGWSLSVASNEANGRVAWPLRDDGPPVDVRFEMIDLALIEPVDDEPAADPAPRPTEPGTIPPLDVRVERLKFTDYTLRDFNMLTGRSGGSMTVHQVGFRSEHLRVSGQGQWQGGANPRTDVRLVVRSDDFGAGLREIGHGGILDDGDGRVTFDIGWPGAPWAPALETLAGDVNVDIEDGVLTEVKPGAARLLGLFSLEAMPFRSLLQSGLIFSEMKGRVDLADGNAFTKLLKIDSAVGLIKISGRTGLVARDYDQRIVVLPELSTSLPVIGFLSGGPLAGAAIALLQGVMRNVGEDIEKSGRIEYVVTGSWDDPVIERVDQPNARARDEGGRPESPR